VAFLGAELDLSFFGVSTKAILEERITL